MPKKHHVKDPYMRRPLSLQESFQLQHDFLPSSKITLKLDVPWTCHSHIIGKSGSTIKPITSKTGVSVHFPDGNKNSETQKSNQVSINSRGEELNGLEEARSYIRQLTPLIFTFALPATAQFLVTPPNFNFSSIINKVQLAFNIKADLQISTDSTPMLLGSVKGSEWEASRVQDATLFLLQNLCGSLASQMPVQLKIEISPQHHSAILGKNSENIKKIMQITATKILFPDCSDPTLPALSKYTVTISGAINNVYLAKQNIVGSFPLVLMFDLLPSQTVAQSDINLIMYALSVSISLRPKRGEGRCSIIMKCAERNAANLYEAWRLLTKTKEQIIKTKIPVNYHVEDTELDLFDFNNYCSQKNAFLTKEYVKNVATISQFDNVSSQFSSPEQSSSLSSSKSEDTLAEELQSIFDLIPDRRAPGCERKQLEACKIDDEDYFAKKILAYKAMKQPVTPKPRTPTSNWSGHGFSKSMPGFVLQRLKEEVEIKPVCEEGLLGTSMGPWAWDLNGIEFIETLLKDLHLEQYIDVFSHERIDLSAFSQLTTEDLENLGIKLFGHRKKLLMAIKSLKENQQKSFFEKL